MNTLLLHIQTPPPPLPLELSLYQPLLTRLLAKQPEQRYPDADTLIDAIDRIRALQALAAQPQSWWQAPWLWTMAGLLLLVGMIAGAAYLLRMSRPISSPEATPLLLHVQTVTVAPATVSMGHIPEQTLPEAPAPAPARELVPSPVQDAALEAEVWALWLQLSQPLPDAETTWEAVWLLALAAPERVLPPEAQQAEVPKAALTVADLLTAGQQALADGRLTQPSGANAQHYFRQVLKLDARNKLAQAGLQQIADALFQKAQTALQQGQAQAASQWVQEGLQVQPKHGKLRTLQTLLRTRGEL